ncbi:hypothetical protein GOODEAATRI_008506 [Goodea atripinnis]|uniref:Uncharacterized protein n=1 Tax=Goodea atripinnis TaxID=208336 RepID=A0ABV0NST0_9TELE
MYRVIKDIYCRIKNTFHILNVISLQLLHTSTISFFFSLRPAFHFTSSKSVLCCKALPSHEFEYETEGELRCRWVPQVQQIRSHYTKELAISVQKYCCNLCRFSGSFSSQIWVVSKDCLFAIFTYLK